MDIELKNISDENLFIDLKKKCEISRDKDISLWIKNYKYSLEHRIKETGIINVINVMKDIGIDKVDLSETFETNIDIIMKSISGKTFKNNDVASIILKSFNKHFCNKYIPISITPFNLCQHINRICNNSMNEIIKDFNDDVQQIKRKELNDEKIQIDRLFESFSIMHISVNKLEKNNIEEGLALCLNELGLIAMVCHRINKVMKKL